MYYKIGISEKAENDLKRISEYLNYYGYNGEYVIKQINTDIDRLNFMPRIHKTLISYKDENGEYRRIVSGKYIIIYQIQDDKINILRIFNQKENADTTANQHDCRNGKTNIHGPLALFTAQFTFPSAFIQFFRVNGHGIPPIFDCGVYYTISDAVSQVPIFWQIIRS